MKRIQHEKKIHMDGDGWPKVPFRFSWSLPIKEPTWTHSTWQSFYEKWNLPQVKNVLTLKLLYLKTLAFAKDMRTPKQVSRRFLESYPTTNLTYSYEELISIIALLHNFSVTQCE